MDGPLTIVEAAKQIRDGTLSPSGLLEQCLARIDVYEPKVQAWVYLDRDRARAEAKALDASPNRGPLHGIPIGIKDIIDVFDMPTGCGSKLWANSYARQDAEVVSRLRAAGALILGKTVTTPYAFLDPPITRNPWNLERTPGGSSSGSAAAVACGMCLGALGSQTGGSTIRPASFCGVAGFKPTRNAIDLDGVLPLAPSLDHIGLIARTAHDIGMLFHVVRKKHSESFLPQITFLQIEDYEPAPVDVSMQNAYTCFQETTKKHYAWHSQANPLAMEKTLAALFMIFAYETANYHSDRYRRHTDDYPERIRNYIESGLKIKRKYYLDARKVMKLTRESIQNAFPDDTSIIAIPATGGPAPDCATTGDPSWQSPWSFAGTPVVSIPLPVEGLPLAVQLIAAPGDDVCLLFAASQIEQILDRPIRLPPI